MSTSDLASRILPTPPKPPLAQAELVTPLTRARRLSGAFVVPR